MTVPVPPSRAPRAVRSAAAVRTAATVVALVLLAGCSGGGGSDAKGGSTSSPAAATTGAGSAGTAEPAAQTSGPTPSGDPTGGATTTPSDGAADPAATPSGTATIGLVDGFPVDLIPIPPKATVTASAVRRNGDRLEVSMSATTKAPVKDILVWYDKRFRAQKFVPADGRTLAPGTGGRIYARGEEIILLAVNNAGGIRSFSVGGTISR